MDYKKKCFLSWQNCEIGSRIVSDVADQSAKYINHNLQSMLHFSPAFIYFISQLLYISKLRVYYEKTEAKYFNCVKNDNVKIDAACLPGLEEEKVAKIFWYIQ